MKLPSPKPTSPPRLFPAAMPARRRPSISGVALVIVLGMLTLMAILLVAFLSSVSTELRSAKSYAVSNDARTMADTAVNIVISQLRDATSTPTLAWASQPGMVRTYDTTGSVVTNYKLYSSDKLRVTGAFNPNSGPSTDPTSQSTDVPSTWASTPDQYTDLNSPVTVSGVNHYPIIDPVAVATSQSSTTAMAAMPDGTTTPIQGCYIDTSNGATTVSGTQTNPVPMPVKWIYVLQDGTLASMSSSGTITTTSGGNPTTANPIVGRVAFWTDDESCKVNINTSGEGTFWDKPLTESAQPTTATSGYERSLLASTIPAANEFQRFPGHPAMTSLSVIFPALGGESVHDYNERIYGIIPRLATGGSQSGTVAVTTAMLPLNPNSNPLFDSVDEFLFNGASATAPRTVNLKAPATNFTDSDIEKVRFFLTANSRSPEVNMFNKPRITLWPIQKDTTQRTAKDQLIAFCSTIGVTPYYFQRFNTYTTPARAGATTFFASLTQNPPPSSQATGSLDPVNQPGVADPNSDWGITRNQTLFAYLQWLTSNPIPGVGGSLSVSSSGGGAKYSTAVRDQILTEMVDFIRSEIASATTQKAPLLSYYYAPGQITGGGGYVSGERQVAPLVINPPLNGGGTATYTTKGFGRFATIKQAALIFYRQDQALWTGTPANNYTYYQGTTPAIAPTGSPLAIHPDATHTVHLGCVFVLDTWNPTPGSRPWLKNVRYTVSGLSECKVGSTYLNIPDGTSLLTDVLDPTFTATAQPGLEYLFRYFTSGPKSILTTSAVGQATEEQYYTFAVPTTLVPTGFPLALDPNNTTLPPYSGPPYNSPNTIPPYNTAPNPPYPLPNYSAGNPPPYNSVVPVSISIPSILTPPGTTTVRFTPGSDPITIQIYAGYDPNAVNNPGNPDNSGTALNPIPGDWIPSTMTPSASALVQTIQMNFPSGAYNMPLPTVSCGSVGSGPNFNTAPWTPGTNNLYTDFNARIGYLANPNAAVFTPALYFSNYAKVGFDADYAHNASPFFQGGDTVLSLEANYTGPAQGDLRVFAALPSVPQNYFVKGPTYGTTSPINHSFRMYAIPGFMESDTSHGAYYGTNGPNGLLISNGTTPANGTYGSYLMGGDSNKYWLYPAVPRGLTAAQVVLTGLDSATHPGDWDNGPGNQIDGPYINKPDESNAGALEYYDIGYNELNVPEEQGTTYSPNRQISSAVAFGSLPTGIDPNNPDLAGTGNDQTQGGIRPWQTLLFCANPEAGLQHPGFGTPVTASSAIYPSGQQPQPPPYTIPPDSAFLDFFTMPIVEPYAISEPFSSAGKVNMNYQIVPFTYLTRDTAVRAVLKSVRVMAIPQTDAGISWDDNNGPAPSNCYKVGVNGPPSPPDYRYTINMDELTGTLAGFQQRFASGDIFRSAAEICSLYLVPQYLVHCAAVGSGETISATTPPVIPTYTSVADPGNSNGSASGWWANYRLTGDNAREQPYGQIYPRLTTKSNTFTVHVRTQSLKKADTLHPTQFTDGVDQVTSEFRGSYIVQRYLDPTSDSLITTDGTTPSNPETYPNSMVGPYKYRIVNTKRFAP